MRSLTAIAVLLALLVTSAARALNRDVFLGPQGFGYFLPIAGSCTSSASCCCGSGPIRLNAHSSNTSRMIMVGSLDGGSGCPGGQTDVTAAFTVLSPTLATYKVPVLNSVLNASLELAGVSVYDDELELISSSQSCTSLYRRSGDCDDGVTSCSNGGTCNNLQGGYECRCVAGWGGQECAEEIDECAVEDGCLNGATCIDLFAAYQCVCSLGFSGDRCEVNIDDCVQGACSNGGTCVDGVESFVCVCPVGWSGDACDVRVSLCDSVNENGGCEYGSTCIDTGTDVECVCPSGVVGPKCVDGCSGAVCSNGGTCVDTIEGYDCICPNGFSGSGCGQSAPGVLSYANNPARYEIDVPVRPNLASLLPSNVAQPMTFTVFPQIFPGLMLDSDDGTITGTPAVSDVLLAWYESRNQSYLYLHMHELTDADASIYSNQQAGTVLVLGSESVYSVRAANQLGFATVSLNVTTFLSAPSLMYGYIGSGKRYGENSLTVGNIISSPAVQLSSLMSPLSSGSNVTEHIIRHERTASQPLVTDMTSYMTFLRGQWQLIESETLADYGQASTQSAHRFATLNDDADGYKHQHWWGVYAHVGTPPLTYSIEPSLPSGLYFDPGTGRISGVATEVTSVLSATTTTTTTTSNSVRTPELTSAVPPSTSPSISYTPYVVTVTNRLTSSWMEVRLAVIDDIETYFEHWGEPSNGRPSDDASDDTVSTRSLLQDYQLLYDENPATYYIDREIFGGNRVSFVPNNPSDSAVETLGEPRDDIVFTSSPDLPEGLLLDKHSGTLYGTPSGEPSSSAHQITARLSSDPSVSSSVQLSIVIAEGTPSSLGWDVGTTNPHPLYRYGVFEVVLDGQTLTNQYEILFGARQENITFDFIDLHYYVDNDAQSSNFRMDAFNPYARTLFSYSPISLPAGSELLFSFTYQVAGELAEDTPWVAITIPQTGDGGSGGGGGSGSGGSGGGTNNFIGVWDVEDTCIPSEYCCCALENVYIHPTEFSDKISVTVLVDGGGGCSGLRTLQAVFLVRSAYHAEHTRADGNFSAVLGANLNQLTLTSTLFPACLSSARRTDLNLPSEQDMHNIVTAHNDDAQSGSGGVRFATNYTSAMQPIPPFLVDVYEFLGEFTPYDAGIDVCVPGPECCCVTELLTNRLVFDVPQGMSTARTSFTFTNEESHRTLQSARLVPAATASKAVDAFSVQGVLDGGEACAGLTDFDITFSLNETDSNRAHYDLNGELITLQSIGDGRILRFDNSLYPTCSSYLDRTGYYFTERTQMPDDSGSGGSGGDSSGGDGSGGGSDPGVRDRFLGQYGSLDTCIPGNQCCCLRGSLECRLPTDDDLQTHADELAGVDPVRVLMMRAGMDGGIACLRTTTAAGACIVQNRTTVICETDVLSIFLTLSDDGQIMRIENSIHNCFSLAARSVRGGSPNHGFRTLGGPHMHAFLFWLGICVYLVVVIEFAVWLGLFEGRARI